MPPTEVLYAETTATDSRTIWGEVTAEGDVAITGQDLGVPVEAFWGGGDEYEWAITVPRADVQALEAMLAGETGDGVLERLRAHLTATRGADLRTDLERRGVPHEFWSHVGG
jgi:hypothetical protein